MRFLLAALLLAMVVAAAGPAACFGAEAEVLAEAETRTAAGEQVRVRLLSRAAARARGIDAQDFEFDAVMSQSTVRALKETAPPLSREAWGSVSTLSGALEVPAFYPWLKVGGSASVTGMHKSGTTVVVAQGQIKIMVDLKFFQLTLFFNGNLFATSLDTHEVGTLLAATIAEVARAEAVKPADYLLEAVNWSEFGTLNGALLQLEQRRRMLALSMLQSARHDVWRIDDEKKFIGLRVGRSSVERALVQLRESYDQFGTQAVALVEHFLSSRLRSALRWNERKQLEKFGGVLHANTGDKLKVAMREMAELLARETLGEERRLSAELIAAIEKGHARVRRMSLLERLIRDISDEPVPPPGREADLFLDWQEVPKERAANLKLVERVRSLLRARLSAISTPGDAPKVIASLDQARISYDLYGELGLQASLKVNSKVTPKRVGPNSNFALEASAAGAWIPFGVRGFVDVNNRNAADNYRANYQGMSFALEVQVGAGATTNLLAKVTLRKIEGGAGKPDVVVFVKPFMGSDAGAVVEALSDFALYANVMHAAREVAGAINFAVAKDVVRDDLGPVGHANQAALERSYKNIGSRIVASVANVATNMATRDMVAAMATVAVAIKAKNQVGGLVRPYKSKLTMGVMVSCQLRHTDFKPSSMLANGGSAVIAAPKWVVTPLFFVIGEASFETPENAVLKSIPIKASLKSSRGFLAAVAVP